MKTPKREPVDKKQCQAEYHPYNFMTLGGSANEIRRCVNKPVWIIKETKSGEDGQRGSMSLCEACYQKSLTQLPKGFAEAKRIKDLVKVITKKIYKSR
jgi:hypothetical protein